MRSATFWLAALSSTTSTRAPCPRAPASCGAGSTGARPERPASSVCRTSNSCDGRTGFTISASTPGMSLSDFPADVSRITARSCSAASDRMAAATAAPSISGIIRSTIATSNGSSLPAARRISRRASWPLSKLRPRMPHEATYRSRIVRLVRLSSMIATVVPPRGALDFGRCELAGASRNRAVNQNRLPFPLALSTPISPPISSASIRAIASPRPVPPWRRVVELSSCE